MEKLRRWIQRLVVASGLLLGVLLFAAGLWGLLAILGDEIGAQFARGAASLIAVSFLMTHILLVTLLARAVLQANMEMEQERSPDRAPRSSPAHGRQ